MERVHWVPVILRFISEIALGQGTCAVCHKTLRLEEAYLRVRLEDGWIDFVCWDCAQESELERLREKALEEDVS